MNSVSSSRRILYKSRMVLLPTILETVQELKEVQFPAVRSYGHRSLLASSHSSLDQDLTVVIYRKPATFGLQRLSYIIQILLMRLGPSRNTSLSCNFSGFTCCLLKNATLPLEMKRRPAIGPAVVEI